MGRGQMSAGNCFLYTKGWVDYMNKNGVDRQKIWREVMNMSMPVFDFNFDGVTT